MFSDEPNFLVSFDFEGIDALENASAREMRPPSPAENGMNLDLEGVIRAPSHTVKQEPEDDFIPEGAPLPSVKEEPAAKASSSSGKPNIRIKREEEFRTSVIRQKMAASASDRNGPRFRVVSGPVENKQRGDKFKRETLNILLIVGLALDNAKGEPVDTDRIYDFFSAHFVKYTKEENTHSWKNTIRTKLTFKDKFTKIPGPFGTKTRGKYKLNLSNGNWVEREVNFIDSEDLFADSGLVEPNVWESMKKGLLGLPPISPTNPKKTIKRETVHHHQDTMIFRESPPTHFASSQQFERIPSLAEFSNGVIGGPSTSAPRRMVMGPSSHQRNVQARPSPYVTPIRRRQATIQTQNQQSNLQHMRSAFSAALHNATNMRPGLNVPLLQRVVPLQIQQSPPPKVVPQEPLAQLQPIPAAETYEDFENLPIDAFDADRILGFR